MIIHQPNPAVIIVPTQKRIVSMRTTVTDPAQTTIAAFSLFVMVLGLVIKYRLEIRQWIVGCFSVCYYANSNNPTSEASTTLDRLWVANFLFSASSKLGTPTSRSGICRSSRTFRLTIWWTIFPYRTRRRALVSSRIRWWSYGYF